MRIPAGGGGLVMRSTHDEDTSRGGGLVMRSTRDEDTSRGRGLVMRSTHDEDTSRGGLVMAIPSAPATRAPAVKENKNT